MKKCFIILLTLSILLLPVSCSKEENNNSKEIADEVIINLPKDNSVNGYRTESSKIQNGSMPERIDADDVVVGNIETQKDTISKDYCGNKNSKVFHKSSCSSVSAMNDNNKYFADRSTLISKGYSPCGKCKP